MVGYLNDVTGQPYFGQVALGGVYKHTYIYKFGRNQLIQATEELIASGGIYGLPPTAEPVITISDDIANDNPTGPGARSIHIFGLDENHEEISEIVTIGEVSDNSYLRVFKAHVETAGTLTPIGGANAGTITISQFTSDIDMVLIDPGDGQTLCACYTVPAGCTALMWSADTTVGAGKSTTNRLKSREFESDAPFRTRGIRDNYENSVGQIFRIPVVYTEKTDIVLTSVGESAGASVSGTFLIELIKE